MELKHKRLGVWYQITIFPFLKSVVWSYYIQVSVWITVFLWRSLKTQQKRGRKKLTLWQSSEWAHNLDQLNICLWKDNFWVWDITSKKENQESEQYSWKQVLPINFCFISIEMPFLWHCTQLFVWSACCGFRLPWYLLEF